MFVEVAAGAGTSIEASRLSVSVIQMFMNHDFCHHVQLFSSHSFQMQTVQ
jgi:hypothetical protein